MLEPADVDGALLAGRQVAPAHAQVRRGTHHAAGEAQRVVGQDGLGRAVVVLGGDAADEALDVELRGARLLARGVRALQTSGRLAQRAALAQSRVLDVVEVLVQVVARPKEQGENSEQ